MNIKNSESTISLPEKKLSVLVVYGAETLHVETTWDFSRSFAVFSNNSIRYISKQEFSERPQTVRFFDVVVIFYSVRVPFSELTTHALLELKRYQGVKAVFLQDEYDRTKETLELLIWAEFDLLFSSIGGQTVTDVIYPKSVRGGLRVVPVQTGYFWPRGADSSPQKAPSDKKIHMVYRGRDLDARYGRLAEWKRQVPMALKAEGEKLNLVTDIAIEDRKRRYNNKWSRFLESGKSTLILPSGSDVFDLDGELEIKLAHPKTFGYADASAVLRDYEVPVFQGVVSPRVFEALRVGTCLVGLEAWYSGVLQPGEHYIPIKTDLSNLSDAMRQLRHDKKLDEVWQNAFSHVMENQHLSYVALVGQFDAEINRVWGQHRGNDDDAGGKSEQVAAWQFSASDSLGLLPAPTSSGRKRPWLSFLINLVRKILPKRVKTALLKLFFS